jgi:hypothetical protein
MNKKILIIIGITLGIVLLILLWGKKNANKEEKTVTISPTPTLVITRMDKTGGLVPERTAEEEKAIEQVTKLRLAAPVDTGDFIITMNWTYAVFEVKAKRVGVDKLKLWSWLSQSGYELIPKDSFKFIE